MAHNVPRVEIFLDRWSFTATTLSRRGEGTIDLTNYITNYTFHKTIKNPAGGAELTAFPQSIGKDENLSLFDEVQPLDVIRIFEYGTLKFQGYLRRIQFTGTMNPDGKPTRMAVLSVTGFGGLFSETSLGLTIGDLNENATQFIVAATTLVKAISDAVLDGTSFNELTVLAINSWFAYIQQIGASAFVDYVSTYLDYTTLVSGRSLGGDLPKSFELFTGTEMQISLWDILQKVIEVPLTELWFDEGPRIVHLDGSDSEVTSQLTYLVLRETPFDNSVEGGVSTDRFARMQSKQIPIDRLVHFDLAKSMDEAVSVYNVVPAAYDFGDLARSFLGHLQVDELNLAKYLVKQNVFQLNYIRSTEVGTTARADTRSVEDKMDDVVATFRNWFSKNDQYLSGALKFLVPSIAHNDVYIGEKVQMESLGFLYVEGVSHNWNYGGPILSTLSVTRGYNIDRAITLRDKIFLSGSTRVVKEE